MPMRLCASFVFALLAWAAAAQPAVAPSDGNGDLSRPDRIEDYVSARHAFESAAAAYWDRVAELRRLRTVKRRDGQEITLADYVLTQPPVYAGPPPPPDTAIPPVPARERKYVPVVADFLAAAKEYFDFVPQRPRSDSEFKRAYARAAAAAGLTRDQIVRIYGFEAGGNGSYDTQAGLEYATAGARAISPALGYNQLLNTNSVELLAEHGDAFVATLSARLAQLSGDAKAALAAKIAVLQRMIAFSRTVPDRWSDHDALANTPRGLGVHAMVLDIDVGPLLQTQKLVDSVEFARRKGYRGTLGAAELEMMNFTGDGNGLDMILMPAALRERVPTSNFFLRASYERNPVAIRNNVVAKLFAATNTKMDREITLAGARELALAVPRSP